MPTIPGEALAPGPGRGSAYILGRTGPDALSILINGQRARDAAAARAAVERARRDAENAKTFNDTVKFEQDGSPYFASGLEQQVYGPLTGQLTDVFKQYRDDAFTRNSAARPLLQKAQNETVQSKAKTKYLHDTLAAFQADKNLYDSDYAGQQLSASLHDGDRNVLPSQFDAEAWKDKLTGDHNLYKEKEVVLRATKGLAPIISQKIAEAGTLGGQHTADMVRGRFVAFDGQGKPMLNADGSPKLNLTADTDTLLDSDPLFKMKTDARVEAYNAKREESIKAHEADPSVPVLPVMSRRGHHAQMVGPLAFYDQTHDETLIRPHFARPAAAKGPVEDDYQPQPFDEKQDVQYAMPNRQETTSATFDGVGAPAQGVKDVTKFTASSTSAQPSYAVYGPPVPPPMDISRSGKKTYKVIKFTPDKYTIMGSGNQPEERKNNTQAIEGTAGELNRAFVDNNGDHIYPKSTQEGLDMVRQGKAKLRVQFDVNTEKNENFAADLKPTTEALMGQTDSNGAPKYPTRELAEAAARKQLSTGTVRTTHLLTPKNLPIVEGAFGSRYRKLQAELDKTNQRLRAEGPQKSKADPLGFTPKPVAAPKAATATTTHKAKANPLGF